MKSVSVTSMSDEEAVSSRICVLSLASIAGNRTAGRGTPLTEYEEGFMIVMSDKLVSRADVAFANDLTSTMGPP